MTLLLNAAFLTGGIALLELLVKAEEGSGQEGTQKSDR